MIAQPHPSPRDGQDARPAAPRILVVEDEFIVAIELEAAMIEAGYEVVGIADSADEAVRLARKTRPALVLMDIRLNGRRDGVDAALEIFDATGARAIFTSAYADADAHARAARTNPHGWIAKPYRMAPLLAMIRAALNRA